MTVAAEGVLAWAHPAAIRWRLQNDEWRSVDGAWRVYLEAEQAEGRPQWHTEHHGHPLLRKNGQVGYWADPGGARRAAERLDSQGDMRSTTPP